MVDSVRGEAGEGGGPASSVLQGLGGSGDIRSRGPRGFSSGHRGRKVT